MKLVPFQTSVILRVFLADSSSATGAGLTGLVFNSAGLIIGTLLSSEGTAVAYTTTGSTIEDITTIGTYAAPTATKCRFKAVDATNFPGVYEIHLADARFASNAAHGLLVSIVGATNLLPTFYEIPFIDQYRRYVNTYDGTTEKFYAVNGSTVIAKRTVSEAAGTVTKGATVTGP